MEATSRNNELKKFRRRNAKLYAIYKMFSWDLLFYYSIEFLFFTITKGITPSQALLASGIYLMSEVVMEIPAITITDFLGRRKSIILGNILLILHLIVLVFMPGMTSIALSSIICALGFDIKGMSETNLLYDSVATRGGDGLYSKINSKGASFYYILDGIASLMAGYLFVINNYLPMIICFIFLLISTIISFGFKDIYDVRVKKEGNLKNTIKEYSQNLKVTSKFIFKSKRMRSFMLFKIVLYSLICIIEIYGSDLLVDIEIPEEQFSIIFAVLTLIGGISISQRKNIEKKFKNRTLTLLSLIYVMSIIAVGIITNVIEVKIAIPIVLFMFVLQRITQSIWYVLEEKYLKNFTREEDRSKITFTYRFIGSLIAGISTIVASILLDITSIENAYIIVGLVGLLFTVLVLDYMRTRFGLKPEEYKKEDLYIK